jgi:hypothetical protein
MATSEAYFRLGVMDEEEGSFERALANQRSCMARAPYGSWARSARLRISWISARSEGDFEPLARLQRVRGDPKLGSDRAALEALARDADSFPPGRVRAEARMFAAEALASTKGAEEEAMALFRKVADDPSSDATDAGLARRNTLQAYVATGRLDDAAAEAQRFPGVSSELSARVRRLVRRRAIERAAVAELILVAVAAVLVGIRGRIVGRRASLKRRRAERLGRAGLVVVSCVTVLAMAFVVMHAAGGKWLDAFGL